MCCILCNDHLLKHSARCGHVRRVFQGIDGSALALQLNESELLHASNTTPSIEQHAANAFHLMVRSAWTSWVTLIHRA